MAKVLQSLVFWGAFWGFFFFLLNKNPFLSEPFASGTTLCNKQSCPIEKIGRADFMQCCCLPEDSKQVSILNY